MMTSYEIKQMEVGEELDKLVAEVVMGWKWKKISTYYGKWIDEDDNEFLIDEWKPSRDISSAWKVFDLLSERGINISIQSPINDYYMAVLNYNYHDPIYIAGKTAPEAICKAALITVLC